MNESELRRILAETAFSDTDLITYGRECAVLRKPGLGFVVKILPPSESPRARLTKRRYREAAEILGGEIAEYSLVPEIRLRFVDGETQDFSEAIIQRQVEALDDAYFDRTSDANLVAVVQGFSEMEHRVMSKGGYPYDNIFMNAGLSNRKVVLIDLGDLLRSFSDTEGVKDGSYRPFWSGWPRDQSQFPLNRRGFVLYERSFKLESEWNKPQAAEAYRIATGLEFDSDVILNQNIMLEGIERYRGKIMAAIKSIPNLRNDYQRLEAQCNNMDPLSMALSGGMVNPLFIFCTRHGKGSILAYNVILRHLYAKQFNDIAEQERDRFFKEGAGGMPAEPFIVPG